MVLFNCIVGVTAIFGGLYSVFWPGISFLNAGWIATWVLLLWGICSMVAYFHNKKQGDIDKDEMSGTVLGLVFGILACILSILAIFVMPIRAMFMLIILILFTVFMLVNGIMRIVNAGKNPNGGSGSKALGIILGILQIIVSLGCMSSQLFAAGLVSVFFGIMLICFGIALIGSAFQPDRYDSFRNY